MKKVLVTSALRSSSGMTSASLCLRLATSMTFLDPMAWMMQFQQSYHAQKSGSQKMSDEDNGIEEESFSIADLRFGQGIVGEQLWVAMRTRPDFLYPVNYMTSKVSKQPQYQYDDGSGEVEAQAHSTISSASRSLGPWEQLEQ